MTRRLLSGMALTLLLVVVLLPVWLAARQAVTPLRLSAEFPIPLWPSETSLDSLRELIRTQSLLSPLMRSLFVALLTSGLSLALALPAGWALARSRWLGAAGLGTSLVARVIPPIAIALPLAALLIRLNLANRPSGIGLALAHLSATLPLSILICHAACRAVPTDFEQAAEIDGAGRLAILWHVMFPLTRGALAAGALLCFLHSWDDFTHALVIQPTARTLPPLIAYVAKFGELSQASALALVMLAPAAVLMGLLSWIVVKSGGISLGTH